MASYWQVLVFSFIGSMVAFTCTFLLIRQKNTANILASYATPFAAGTLLAAVFFDLLPESIAESSVQKAMISAITGLLVFFYLEHFLRWFHHHHEHSDSHDSAPKTLIVIGDIIHNALDGVVIAAAFLVSLPAGVIAVFAIAAHEVPQELGNIGLLLNHGMSRKNAMIINGLSVVSTVMAAIIVFTIGNIKQIPLGILLGISAGFLLYIATSDVIPMVHKQSKKSGIISIKPFLLLIGVLLIGTVIVFSKKIAG